MATDGRRDHRAARGPVVAERQHGGAGGESRREDERSGESRREDESVVPELDASRHCGGDPRGDLEDELVDAKALSHEVHDLRGDIVAQIEALQHAVRVQGRRERPRAVSADVVVLKVQPRERRVVVEGRRKRARALIADGSTSTFAVPLLGTVGTVVIAELGWNLLFLSLLLLLFPATALWGRRALRCAGDASTRGSALVDEQARGTWTLNQITLAPARSCCRCWCVVNAGLFG